MVEVPTEGQAPAPHQTIQPKVPVWKEESPQQLSVKINRDSVQVKGKVSVDLGILL